MAEPLSIIGAVAGCQQIMFRLLTVVKALAMAEKERASMILRLHHQTLLLQWFSEFLTDSESKLGADLRNHFNIIIRHMKLTLDDALIEMEKLSKRKPTRFLWALMGNGLKDSEKELSDWSMRLVIALAFVPMPLKTTFIDKLSDTTGGNSLPPCLLGLIANIRMEKGKIDVPAGSTNQNTTDVLDEPEPWDSIKPEYREQLWVDRIKTRLRSPRGPMTMDEIQLEVGKLFAVLKQADSMSNHILTAKHFLVMDDQDQRFAIASSLPGDTARKQLLSDMLLEPSKHPLDQRIRAAREFVSAIAYVHAMDWVHKAVRPSNILMLHSHDDEAFPEGLGHAYLVGFEYARRGSARSTGSGHGDWKDDIYRHPDRQNKDGVDLEKYFQAKHDVYSAGVVLLELGAWTTLARVLPGLKLADPDERRRLLRDYCGTIAGAVGSRYAALARKCIAVDDSAIDVQDLLTELQELRL